MESTLVRELLRELSMRTAEDRPRPGSQRFRALPLRRETKRRPDRSESSVGSLAPAFPPSPSNGTRADHVDASPSSRGPQSGPRTPPWSRPGGGSETTGHFLGSEVRVPRKSAPQLLATGLSPSNSWCPTENGSRHSQNPPRARAYSPSRYPSIRNCSKVSGSSSTCSVAT